LLNFRAFYLLIQTENLGKNTHRRYSPSLKKYEVIKERCVNFQQDIQSIPDNRVVAFGDKPR